MKERPIKRLSRIALPLVLLIGFASALAKPMPDLKLHNLAGEPQKTGSLRGSIAVVTFWATWCGPCHEELPRLSRLKQKYAQDGVRFLAISIDDAKDRAKIEPFLQHDNIELEVWVGADVDTLGRAGLGDIVPGTLILDKDQQVVGRIMGEAQDADVASYLDWLLHDRQGPAPPPLLKRY